MVERKFEDFKRGIEMADRLKFYINDSLHLNKWPKIGLSDKKGAFQREGNSVFTFDIGDAMDRHPLTEATDGQKM